MSQRFVHPDTAVFRVRQVIVQFFFLRISPITVRESFGRVGSYSLPLLPQIADFGYAKAGAGIY